MLGGGPHVVTTTVRIVVGAEASPETAITITRHWSSRLPIVRFLGLVSTAVSGQIGSLSSPRMRRCPRISRWWPVAQDSAALAASHGGPCGSPVSLRTAKEEATQAVHS
jgi:hypothetical protein